MDRQVSPLARNTIVSAMMSNKHLKSIPTFLSGYTREPGRTPFYRIEGGKRLEWRRSVADLRAHTIWISSVATHTHFHHARLSTAGSGCCAVASTDRCRKTKFHSNPLVTFCFSFWQNCGEHRGSDSNRIAQLYEERTTNTGSSIHACRRSGYNVISACL